MICSGRRSAAILAMEELLARNAERIAFAFCGHTHRAATGRLARHPRLQYRRRLPLQASVMAELAVGSVSEHQFGDPVK